MKGEKWLTMILLIVTLVGIALAALVPDRAMSAARVEAGKAARGAGPEPGPAGTVHNPTNLPNANVRSVTCSPGSGCWFATWGGVGVYQWETGLWTSFTTANSGLAHSYCHDVAVDQAGMVWITHHFVGASLLDTNGTLFDHGDDRWLTYTPADGLGSDFMVNTVEVDGQGRKWFGHNNGISVLDDGGTPFIKSDDLWTQISSADGLPIGPVNAILLDSSGCVWAGTDFGLGRSCGGTWQELTWPGVPGCLACCWSWPGFVWELGQDELGNVWVADGSCGAAWYDGSDWEICDTADANCGLPEDDDGMDAGVRALALDRYGNTWFGTRGNGAARLDGLGHWTVYTTTESWLGSNWIEAIGFDARGHGWFGTWANGVFEYAPADSASAVVLPGSGGALAAPDGRARASFPPGSVNQATVVSYQAAEGLTESELLDVFSFDLTAVVSGTTTPVTSFDPPFTLAVRYTDKGRGAAIEATLGLYWWDGGAWVPEPTSLLDTVANRVTATPNHMTHFGLLGQTKRGYLPVILR